MNSELVTRRAAGTVALAVSLVVVGGYALAQQAESIPEVKVEASAVTKKRVGTTTIGAPVETAEITMRVSYDDLHLDSNSGQSLLRRRVQDAAQEACERLDSMYAPGTPGTSTRECVRKAMADATPQVDAIIAAAKTHREAQAP